MRARLFQPSRTAMSSGSAKTRKWILEFARESAREIDPLMGWTSSSDTQSQVRLSFDTLDAAKAYAKEHDIELVELKSNKRKPNIRARGYAENFAVDRRGAWTH